MKILQNLSVMTKVMLSYCILIILIISILTSYILMSSTESLNRNIEGKITLLTEMLSGNTTILQDVKNGSIDLETKEYLKNIEAKTDLVDFIVIANKKGIRLYHPDEQKVGKHFSGGDEKAALDGKADYVTEGMGSDSYQKRAFSSIKDEKGEVIGFVMVSAYAATIDDLKKNIIYDCIGLGAGAFIIGIILAYVLSKAIKRSLLGYEPSQLLNLYLQREEVLESLEEGIIAIDSGGEYVYANIAAKEMFVKSPGKDSEINNFIKEHLIYMLDTKKTEYNEELEIQDTQVLIDKIPIIEDNKIIAVIALIRNKTEITKMAEQLTGVKHMVDALRSNTHEYVNKLHVILGLLQIGEINMAMDYIDTSKREEEGNSGIIKKIEEPTIAALIMGKQSRARELNIKLNLQKDSYLESQNKYLPTNQLLTILGNLIENAIDAVKNKTDVREISVFIQSNERGIMIIVDDTGIGMNNQDKNNIFAKNYSTKGSGRGIGLCLVKDIVEKKNGTVEVESEKGMGSSFIITIN